MSDLRITDSGELGPLYSDYLAALGVEPWRQNATVSGMIRALAQEELLCTVACPFGVGRLFEDRDGRHAELTAYRIIVTSCLEAKFSVRIFGRYITGKGELGNRIVTLGHVTITVGRGGYVNLDGFTPVDPDGPQREQLPAQREVKRLIAAAGFGEALARITREPGCVFIHLNSHDEEVYEMIRKLGFKSRRLGRMSGRKTRVVTLERPD